MPEPNDSKSPKPRPIDWSTKVANPDAIGEADKELWLCLEPILIQLFDELWKADKVETLFEQKEKAALRRCIEKQDDFGRLYLVLLSLSDTKGKFEEFVKVAGRFGFTESMAVLNFIVLAISSTLLKTELFKLVLLFHLKVKDKSVANFPRTMQRVAPETWKKLQPFVDSPLRNALAHGTYAIQNGSVTVFKNAQLTDPEELGFGDFIMKTKTQDVLLQCLINVLRDKGLFAPMLP